MGSLVHGMNAIWLFRGGDLVAIHALTQNFNYFFRRLNPSPTFEQQAQSEHNNIRSLIENPHGPAAVLSPKCFLQGSYKQDTAIYTINDVDIVALCQLWQPSSGGIGIRFWGRDEIFATIAAPLLTDARYRDKVRYSSSSMCIKVDLGIKIEILPVVFKAENYDPTIEPFRLYRPEKLQWDDGYARFHQDLLTTKNTSGNFKPAIKIFKHLRSMLGLETVSFHIECLLYALPDDLFIGNPAEYITKILNFISNWSASVWYETNVRTPCGERSLFTSNEWGQENWNLFHQCVVIWAECANQASNSLDINVAIRYWQILLGENFFPRQVSS